MKEKNNKKGKPNQINSIPKAGQLEFQLDRDTTNIGEAELGETIVACIDLNELLKLDASNVPDHTPVSFTIIIECHGDYLGSVMRVEDNETFSRLSSPVKLSFEHSRKVKQLVDVDDPDVVITYRRFIKTEEFKLITLHNFILFSTV